MMSTKKVKTRPVQQTAAYSVRYHERPESNLVTIPIGHISDALRVFGEKTAKGYTPLVLVPACRGVTDLLMCIPHGFDSIVTENGSTIGVFKPGRYFRSYFFQVSYLVTKQRIPYHFAVKNCPTRDNVRVDVYVDFLFHLADSMKFVTQISAENMEELLRATQAESVRSLVRNVRVDQVLDLRGMNSEDMLVTLNDKLSPYGFTIDQVTIASVHLPEDVTIRLQNTTTFESKQLLQEKAQELQMRQLNGQQYYESVRQQRINEKQRTEELAKKNRAAIEQEISSLRTKLAADLERIQDGLYNQMAQIEATRAVEIGRINAERDKLCAELRSEGAVRANDPIGGRALRRSSPFRDSCQDSRVRRTQHLHTHMLLLSFFVDADGYAIGVCQQEPCQDHGDPCRGGALCSRAAEGTARVRC